MFTAPAYSAAPAESRINLREGERMTVEDLLEALLLESANDAAVALAENISGSREAFVEEMNDRAAELGLDHTSYANPIGLDEPGNYSSARDLATLASVLLRNPRFARIVDMPQATLESGDAAARRGEPERPGRRLPVGQRREDRLHAERRQRARRLRRARPPRARGQRRARASRPRPRATQDTLTLLRWGLDRFSRVRVLDRDRALARADIEYRDETRRLVPRRGVVLTVRDGQRLRRRVNAPDELEGPIAAGERVGSVTVLVDGRPVRRVALVTATDVPGAGTLRVLVSVLGVPLTLLIAVGILVAAILAILRLRFRIRIAR